MKNILIGLLILNLLTSCSLNSQTKEQDMIPIEKIEEMYSNMKSIGVDITADFLYGYFFISKKPKRLKKAVPDLEAMSFRFVDIYQSDDKIWWLHVERIESHSAQSLFDLNKKLYNIADKFKIEYDGYDLGNPDPTKAIELDTYVVPEEYKGTDFIKDGFPMLLVGNAAFDRFPHKGEFKYFVKITTAYEHDANTMLPFEKGLEDLDNFEIFIENNFTQNGIANYYVIRLTHKGIRTFYIAVSDSVGATEILKLIKAQGSQRDFEFEIIEDKDWKLYTDLREKLPKEE